MELTQMSNLTIYCGALIAYEQPSYAERKSGAMAVTVTDANIGKIVEAVGTETLLDSINLKVIADYLKQFGCVVSDGDNEQMNGGE